MLHVTCFKLFLSFVLYDVLMIKKLNLARKEVKKIRRKLILSIIAGAVVLTSAVALTQKANADNNNFTTPPIIDKLVEKFT